MLSGELVESIPAARCGYRSQGGQDRRLSIFATLPRRRLIGFALLVALVPLPVCQSPDATVDAARRAPAPIAVSDAVSIAEQFARDNGYTSWQPASPQSLTPESIEMTDRSEWLEFRHDSLSPTAYGYSHGRRRGAAGWTVVFRYKSPADSPDGGRAVTMDEHGNEVQMEHVDFFLDKVEVKL